MKTDRWACCVTIGAIACWWVPAARAGRIPVTGAAFLGADVQQFQISGTFSAFSAWPGGPAIFGACDYGAGCDVTREIAAFPGPGYSLGSLGGSSTTLLYGRLRFIGSFTLEPGMPTGARVPVTVLGRLLGLEGEDPARPGRKLFDVLLEGNGILELAGFDAGGARVFDSGNYAFTGTATPVTEPATCLLLGLAVFLMQARRRRRSRMDAASH